MDGRSGVTEELLRMKKKKKKKKKTHTKEIERTRQIILQGGGRDCLMICLFFFSVMVSMKGAYRTKRGGGKEQ